MTALARYNRLAVALIVIALAANAVLMRIGA